MIPQNYQQWRQCLVRDCGITLTGAFIAERLSVFEKSTHEETRRFVAVYGQAHLNNIIQWYRQAAREMSARSQPA